MFDQLFGGKSWYKSMVGWAALIFTLAQTAVPGLAQIGAIDVETATTLTGWMTSVSALLGGIGIRRRLPATGTAS